MVLLVMQGEIRDIAVILGEEKILRQKIEDVRDLESLTQEGLPKRALQRVARYLAVDGPLSKIIYKFVPESTYKRKTKLSPEVSEKAVRVARLIALGEHILGHRDHAVAFLTKHHRLLDNRKPYEVALTEIGARRVEELLWKIFYGLPV